MDNKQVVKQESLFSIITVCRNAEKTIERTLQSVIRQEEVKGVVEHIVVDGVSTDGTLKIVKKYPGVHWISEPDEGLYDAMNKGISMAKGKYIGILNADDWYELHALKLVKSAFEENAIIGLVHGDMMGWVKGRKSGIIKRKRKPWSRFFGMPLAHPTCFVRRDIYEQCGVFNPKLKIAADYDFILRLYEKSVKMHYIPAVLTNFSIGGLSTSEGVFKEGAFKEDVLIKVSHGYPWPWAVFSTMLYKVWGKLWLLRQAAQTLP